MRALRQLRNGLCLEPLKPFNEVFQDYKQRLRSIDSTMAEASALEEAQGAQAQAAKEQLDLAAMEIKGLVEEETAHRGKALRAWEAEGSGAAKSGGEEKGALGGRGEAGHLRFWCSRIDHHKQIPVTSKCIIYLRTYTG